jgi:drug/metabolite transporter (DMT)-like permease
LVAYGGEIAALVTAFCWANTSMFFAAAGKRIGSFHVNQTRIVFAVVFLLLAHLVLRGSLWPMGVSGSQYAYLAASGLVGLFLGDSFYFKALVDLGPKLATLMMSLYPIFAAFIAWVWLNEALGAQGLAGMGIALSGVIVVVLGRRQKGEKARVKHLMFGLLFGLLGAIGQGGGIVLAKRGLVGLNALPGTLIRMAAAAAVLWSIAAVQLASARKSGKPMALAKSIKNFRAMGFTAGGAFLGPFFGVWLSLYAITHGQVGVVCTIMATIPIIVIPQVWILHRERPTLLEVLGAILAIEGISLLFL